MPTELFSIETSDKENAEMLKRLKGASKKTIAALSKITATAALNISKNARRRVAKGPKTGLTYITRGILHRASAPGEAPATDTGFLVNSIISTSKKLSAEAGSTIKYAPYLEFGSDQEIEGGEILPRRLEPRPFLQPAIDEEWPEAQELLADELSRILES